MRESLIPIDKSEPPPTADQIEAHLKNAYGFDGIDASRVRCLHFDPLVLSIDHFFDEDEVSERLMRVFSLLPFVRQHSLSDI